MSPETVQQVTARLNVFIGAKGDRWCLTEGPSAQAVFDGHKAMGKEMDISQVHEVQSVV